MPPPSASQGPASTIVVSMPACLSLNTFLTLICTHQPPFPVPILSFQQTQTEHWHRSIKRYLLGAQRRVSLLSEMLQFATKSFPFFFVMTEETEIDAVKIWQKMQLRLLFLKNICKRFALWKRWNLGASVLTYLVICCTIFHLRSGLWNI